MPPWAINNFCHITSFPHYISLSIQVYRLIKPKGYAYLQWFLTPSIYSWVSFCLLSCRSAAHTGRFNSNQIVNNKAPAMTHPDRNKAMTFRYFMSSTSWVPPAPAYPKVHDVLDHISFWPFQYFDWCIVLISRSCSSRGVPQVCIAGI